MLCVEVNKGRGRGMISLARQEVAIVDKVGREVSILCHDEMSADPNIEAGSTIVRVRRFIVEVW